MQESGSAAEAPRQPEEQGSGIDAESASEEAPLEIEIIEKALLEAAMAEEAAEAEKTEREKTAVAQETDAEEKAAAAQKAEAARLKALKENSPNLWKRSDAPHSGWTCVGVEDLGSPSGICEMCGYQIIRYAHQMEHPGYRSLSVGCVCAGRMEGDIGEAKRREADFKSRQSRRISFFKRQWKRSKKGNEYLKVDDHVAVIYHDTRGKGSWKYSIDNEFCRTAFADREHAVAGVFDALERLKGGS